MARNGSRDPQRLLRRHLTRCRWPDGQAARKGLVYDGPTGFVLEHGEAFTPQPLPAGIRSGAARACYGNALAVAVLYGLEYVEGWALSADLSGPHHHAWNVDGEGRVIDSTWCRRIRVTALTDPRGRLTVGLPGAAYLGVRFGVERADDCTWNGDANVLDDWKRGWPLLRERWNGEPPDLTWPPSPRLQRLRRGFLNDPMLRVS